MCHIKTLLPKFLRICYAYVRCFASRLLLSLPPFAPNTRRKNTVQCTMPLNAPIACSDTSLIDACGCLDSIVICTTFHLLSSPASRLEVFFAGGQSFDSSMMILYIISYRFVIITSTDQCIQNVIFSKFM